MIPKRPRADSTPDRAVRAREAGPSGDVIAASAPSTLSRPDGKTDAMSVSTPFLVVLQLAYA